MTIKIYPEDIVRMCLWDNYVYYIVGSEKEAEKILKENKEMEMSERDALVIGLLKIIISYSFLFIPINSNPLLLNHLIYPMNYFF